MGMAVEDIAKIVAVCVMYMIVGPTLILVNKCASVVAEICSVPAYLLIQLFLACVSASSASCHALPTDILKDLAFHYPM